MIVAGCGPQLFVFLFAITFGLLIAAFFVAHLRAMRRVRDSLRQFAESFGWNGVHPVFLNTSIRGTFDGQATDVTYRVEGKNGPRTLVMRSAWEGRSRFVLRRAGRGILRVLWRPFDPPVLKSGIALPSDVQLRSDDPVLADLLLSDDAVRQQLLEAVPRFGDEVRIGRGRIRVRREMPRIADPARGALQLSFAPSAEQLAIVASEEWAIVLDLVARLRLIPPR